MSLNHSIDTIKDPTSPGEILRLMPAGVKRWMRHIATGGATTDLPAPILDWLHNRGVMRASGRPEQAGRPVLTRTGKQITTQLAQRMKGNN